MSILVYCVHYFNSSFSVDLKLTLWFCEFQVSRPGFSYSFFVVNFVLILFWYIYCFSTWLMTIIQSVFGIHKEIHYIKIRKCFCNIWKRFIFLAASVSLFQKMYSFRKTREIYAKSLCIILKLNSKYKTKVLFCSFSKWRQLKMLIAEYP